MHRSPGHVARLLLAMALLAALFAAHHDTRPALAAGPATSFFLLTTDNRIIALTDALPDKPATPVAITGITAGETLVGIDVRPQNGLLYGLGVNATANIASLYLINPWNGVSRVVGTAGQVAFTTNGTIPVDLPDPDTVGYGFDFNPAVDRVRVVAGSLNFRVNPNTSGPVDGDNTGLTSGAVTGTNPDGPTKGGTTTVDAAAYTNNMPNNGNITTLYTLDAASNRLFIQNPPNTGTQTLGQTVTLNSGVLDFTSFNGFDIPPGVNAPSSSMPVASGAGYAMLTVGGAVGLYTINLVSGVATFLGTPGNLSVRSMAIWSPLPSGIALTADGSSLVRFGLDTPGTTTTQAMNLANVVAGETLVGIDSRPATGQLYGLGINATANTGTLYLIDPQTGVVTLAIPGTASLITFAGVDFPDPTTTGYGFDFNPTVDRIRVTTGTGRYVRVNPITGLPAAATPDGAINGLPGGSTGVAAAAYTNNYVGTTTTTLYTIDPTSNQLFIQNPPNNGTQTNPLPLTLNGAPLDATGMNGFDIPPGASVATSNVPASGNGYAELTVGGTTSLYQINLATGAATLLGAIGTGATAMSGFVAWSEALKAQLTVAATSVSESIGTVDLTLRSTGGTPMIASYTVGGGSATPGADYTVISGTLLLGGTTISQTISLPIINDSLPENNETVQVQLLGADGVAQTLTLTIVDNDPRVKFSAPGYSGSEVAGTALVTVTLDKAAATTTSVHYATANGTATAGSDYTASGGTLTFAPGQTSKTLSIPILADQVADPGESFSVTLSAPVGIVLSTPSSVQVTIADNPPGYKVFLPLVTR
jgi:hypothetical protein